MSASEIYLLLHKRVSGCMYSCKSCCKWMTSKLYWTKWSVASASRRFLFLPLQSSGGSLIHDRMPTVRFLALHQLWKEKLQNAGRLLNASLLIPISVIKARTTYMKMPFVGRRPVPCRNFRLAVMKKQRCVKVFQGSEGFVVCCSNNLKSTKTKIFRWDENNLGKLKMKSKIT